MVYTKGITEGGRNMSKTLSLKMRDDLFVETEQLIHSIHQSRNAYINDAVAFYNRINQRRSLRNQMVNESRAVYRTSAEVLDEFDQLQDEIPE
jgi:hypothetical protein